MSSNLIQSQLNSLGFVRGSPFDTVEAEMERLILGEIFVSVEGLDQIALPMTKIVSAPRGNGKSALRVYLANESAPSKSDADTLSIEYTNFKHLVDKHKSHQPIVVEDYVKEILRLGSKTLFDLITSGVQLPQRPFADRLNAMLRAFAPEVLEASSLYERLQNTIPDPTKNTLDWDGFRRALNNLELSKFLLSQQGTTLEALKPLATIIDIDPEYIQVPQSAYEQMQLFVTLAGMMGYHQVQILFDRVDELAETMNAPEVQADILAPILGDLILLERKNPVYKFFLPQDTRDVIYMRELVRRDRIPNQAVTIAWSNQKLKELLDARLKWFSDARVPDMATICKGEIVETDNGGHRLGEWIEKEMITMANGSPRELINAGRALFTAFSSRADADLVVKEDWLVAKNALTQNPGHKAMHVPVKSHVSPQTVIIDPANTAQPHITSKTQSTPTVTELPQLYVSKARPHFRLCDKYIDLSKLEHGILLVLLDQHGACSRQVITDKVWGEEAVNEQMLDQRLSALRTKIRKAGGDPTKYIRAKSGKVVLTNATEVD